VAEQCVSCLAAIIWILYRSVYVGLGLGLFYCSNCCVVRVRLPPPLLRDCTLVHGNVARDGSSVRFPYWDDMTLLSLRMYNSVSA